LFKNSLNLKNITNQFDLSTAKISFIVGIIIGHQNKTKLIWNFFFDMERKINLASFQYSSCRGHACLNVYRENQRASRHVQNLSRGLPKSLWAQGTIRGLGDKKKSVETLLAPVHLLLTVVSNWTSLTCLRKLLLVKLKWLLLITELRKKNHSLIFKQIMKCL
jgi:hypothetical protein